MVKEYVILSIILVALFSGCIGEESITGKYVQIDDPKSYFYLYEDGTFNAFFSDNKSESGTYRMEEGQIILTYLPFGNAQILTKNGTIWVKENGYKYAKQ
jgi:hypothetical protein